MRNLTLGLALSACALTACGGDPMVASRAALAGRDAAKAAALLEGVLKDHPQLRPAHLERYVACQYLVSQGDPAQQKQYQDQALAEYDWLVKSYGLTADYHDMDGSFKGSPQAAADLAAERKPLYGN